MSNENPLYAVKTHISSISNSRLIDSNEAGIDYENLDGAKAMNDVLDMLLRRPVLPNEPLRPFGRIRKEVNDFLWEFTQRTELGDVFDKTNAEKIYQKLADLQEEFRDEKSKLKAQYDTICQNHVNKQLNDMKKALQDYPELADHIDLDRYGRSIAGAQPDWSYIERQIDFKFFFAEVGKMDFVDDDELAKKLAEGREDFRVGAYSRLLSEIAKESSDIFRTLQNSDKPKLQTFNRVKKVREKVFQLGFLDGRLKELQSALDQTISTIPKEGSVDSGTMGRFMGLLSITSDEKRLKDHLDADSPFTQFVDEEVKQQHANQVDALEAETDEQEAETSSDVAEVADGDSSTPAGQEPVKPAPQPEQPIIGSMSW